MRLDQSLAQKFTYHSRTYWKKLIEQGQVTVNGAVITEPRYAVNETDDLESIAFEPAEMHLQPENIPLDIVYEDDHILVLNKPVGLVVHPAPGHKTGTLVHALLYHCASLSGIGGIKRPGIIHRLDKDTSGLMLVVKTDHAHLGLVHQLQNRMVKRFYKALVHGVPSPVHGTINASLMHDFERMKVSHHDKAKEAITHYWVERVMGDLETPLNQRYSLVRCQLETGRTHQIRVHMKHIGHPVVGDPLYGKPHPLYKTQCLHAYKLAFTHPIDDTELCFKIALPAWGALT